MNECEEIDDLTACCTPCTICQHGTYGTTTVNITVDIEDPKPLFTQLIDQIKRGVSDGQLKPGDALPSIRQLANDLELNNKTVAKAYRLLERDSVVQSRGYRGTFIHPDARANSSVDLTGWVESTLTETIASFRDAGVTDAEIRVVFSNVMKDSAK